jgi:hypothetical protein
LRRYKRRLKSHSDQKRLNEMVTQAPEKIFAPEGLESQDELPADFAPVVIAESNKTIPSLSVSEAVMQLEVGSHDFVLFKSASQNALSLVYKRNDTNIGWLEL